MVVCGAPGVRGTVSSVTELHVQKLQPVEWPTLRELRLTALAEAPAAFASTRAKETAYTQAQWESWLTTTTFFVARRGIVPVGLVGGFGTGDHRKVISMWVAPSARGKGAAHLLVTAVVAWARQAGALRIDLDVADGNEPARHLYEHHGFVPTGVTRPLPHSPEITEIEMSLLLEGSNQAAAS